MPDDPGPTDTRRPAVHADTPVGREGDLLGRRPFAQLIARQIRSVRPTQGFVTAVVGEWGSGKTSVLRMVADELREAPDTEAGSHSQEIVVLDFNPWLFSGSEQLAALFFVALARQLPDEIGSDRAANAADRLQRYGAALGTLRALPGIGGLFGAGADVAQEAARRVDPSSVDLRSQRQALASALEDLAVHLVVLIDDVDRLQTEAEIRDLMRMVKLVGDLPGVTYVLSYDRRPVVAALSSKSISGHEYLEKIVQVEHRVPEPGRERLMAMLGSELDAALVDEPQDRLDPDRWPEVFAKIIQPLITTPRHVRRYSNALRLALDLHHEEVDLVDQLALTAIATFLPTLHAQLPKLADVLLPSGGIFSGLFLERDREIEKARLEHAASECGNREVALATYALVFPRTAQILRGTADVGRFTERDAQRRRRVADPQAFWTYVTAAIPEEGLTVAEVRAILETMESDERLLAALRERDLDELGRLFLRLRAHTGDIPEQHIQRVARLITTFLPERTRGRVETVDDPRQQILWFTVDLVAELPDDTRHAFLTAWAAEEDAPDRKLAVYEISRYKTNAGDPLIGSGNLRTLHAELANAVCRSSSDELRELDVVGRLLYLAGSYLEEHDLGALRAVLEDDWLFIRYLAVFTEPSFGEGPRPLAWSGLKASLGDDWLVDRVARVQSDPQLPPDLAEVLATAQLHAATGSRRDGPG